MTTTPTDRAAFEAWAVTQPWLEDDEGRVNLRYLGLHKQYVDMTVEHASRVFAAATAAERERAAKVCEGMHEEDRPGDYAHAIRSGA